MGWHMVGASQRLAGRQIPSEFGSALKIKRRGGVLLGEHRGGGYCVWPLYMKSDRKPLWFPFRQQTEHTSCRLSDGSDFRPEACWASFQTKKTGTRAEVRGECGRFL